MNVREYEMFIYYCCINEMTQGCFVKEKMKQRHIYDKEDIYEVETCEIVEILMLYLNFLCFICPIF